MASDDATMDATTSEADRPASTSPNAPTVLVVDDDADVRELVVQVLSDEGFCVRTAADGCEALELMAMPPRPVAMLLDLVMPRMGGHEVLQQLRQRDDLPNLPVCVLSGERDLPTGASLAVHKPLLVHRLVQVLNWLRECSLTHAEAERMPSSARP